MSAYHDIGSEDNKNDALPSDPPQNSGEFHVVRPDSGRSYRDAGYMPESETKIPPRYYIPADKPPKEKKSGDKAQMTFAKIASLCLICAIIGGLTGGTVTGFYFESKESATTTPIISTADSGSASENAGSAPASGGISANDIYDLGCKQTVGITTEVTTTNIFGMTSSDSISGSGFIISADGYIMTNYHVIADAYKGGYKVSVITYGNSSYIAEIVGFDADNDIAVLKIDATGLDAVTIGNSDSISVGDTVYAIGNPLGELSYTMTSGIVSATNRVITTDESTSINMFQFDAAVNPGNSGGPVYNSSGNIVGIVTAKYSSTGVEGLGFAIPINDAVAITNELITNGYVTGKPHMGIVTQTVSAGVAQYYNMVQGAYIYSIEPGSCAEKSGLKVGDIITELDGVAITTSEELKAAVKQHSSGDTVEMTVFRSGDYLTLTVTFDEAQPDSSESSSGNVSIRDSETSGYPYDQGW